MAATQHTPEKKVKKAKGPTQEEVAENIAKLRQQIIDGDGGAEELESLLEWHSKVRKPRPPRKTKSQSEGIESLAADGTDEEPPKKKRRSGYTKEELSQKIKEIDDELTNLKKEDFDLKVQLAQSKTEACVVKERLGYAQGRIKDLQATNESLNAALLLVSKPSK